MRQELVFSAKLPMPEDYFAGVEQTSKAKAIIGEAETKLAEVYGEPVNFTAALQPWKDPNAKPRGRAAANANAAAAAAAAANGATGATGGNSETTGGETAAAGPTGGTPQAAGEVARRTAAR